VRINDVATPWAYRDVIEVVDVVNQAFSPDQDSYDRAEQILEAYAEATGVQHRGAVMLGDEVIDEASRKLALVTAAKGRAAGLARRTGTPDPGGLSSAEHPPAGQRLGQPAGQG
jgi:citrate lyase beta subunit